MLPQIRIEMLTKDEICYKILANMLKIYYNSIKAFRLAQKRKN